MDFYFIDFVVFDDFNMLIGLEPFIAKENPYNYFYLLN
jgi:hypothetical protein